MSSLSVRKNENGDELMDGDLFGNFILKVTSQVQHHRRVNQIFLEFQMSVICLFFLGLMAFTCPNHLHLLFPTINSCDLYYFILFSC